MMQQGGNAGQMGPNGLASIGGGGVGGVGSGMPNVALNAKLMGNMIGLGMGPGPDLDAYANLPMPMGAGLPSSGPQTPGSLNKMQQMQHNLPTQSMNSLQQQAQANLRGRTASIGSIGQSPTPPQSPQQMHESLGNMHFRQGIPGSPGQDVKRMAGLAGNDMRYTSYARGPSPQDYKSSQSPQQHQFAMVPDTWSDADQ